MRFYRHAAIHAAIGNLYIGYGPLNWLNTCVDGTSSKTQRTPLFCHGILTGRIALVHTDRWAYLEYLTEIDEASARQLDNALVERVGRIERGEEEPRFQWRTRWFGYLEEAPRVRPRR
jgi:hypothetical protein